LRSAFDHFDRFHVSGNDTMLNVLTNCRATFAFGRWPPRWTPNQEENWLFCERRMASACLTYSEVSSRIALCAADEGSGTHTWRRLRPQSGSGAAGEIARGFRDLSAERRGHDEAHHLPLGDLVAEIVEHPAGQLDFEQVRSIALH